MLFAITVLTFPANAEATKKILFNSESIRNARGENYCNLSTTEDVGKEGLYLGPNKEYAVEQRWNGKYLFLFLLKNSKPPRYCGTILDVLDLSNVRTTEEFVLFKCQMRHRVHTKSASIMGLGDNHKGAIRYVKPSKAWQANSSLERFMPIDPKNVICDTAVHEY